MRIKLVISTALFAGLTAGFAIAPASGAAAAPLRSLQTGSDLAEACASPANAKAITDEESQRLQVCGAYINGFLAHYSFVRRQLDKPSFCLPDGGVNGERVRQVYLALLKQKPELQDMPASLDMATSLAWAYPCKGKTSEKAK